MRRARWPAGLEVVEFACGIPHLLKGGFTENVSTGVDAYSIRQPLGVVAGITPFNFPAMVPMWMFPIALACGNTFVLKPSEKDPSASLLLAELLAEAGLPDGVFNVVHGDKRRGRRAARRTRTSGRSASSARRRSRATSTRRRPATASACRRSAAPRTTWSCCRTRTLTWPPTPRSPPGFGSAGERCMAISVLVAVDPIADELVGKIRDRIAELTVGPGDADGSEMGPLVTREHRDKVATYLDSGVGRRRDARRRRPRRTRSPAAPPTASGSGRRCSTT